jgi:osmoprotectant transport system ATP-binding protein
VAHVGESARSAWTRASDTGSKYVLLLDGDNRPNGWLPVEQLASDHVLEAGSVDASTPLVSIETTLRDALSMLLASSVQTAVVVDQRGVYAGVLTLETLGNAFRSDGQPESVGAA